MRAKLLCFLLLLSLLVNAQSWKQAQSPLVTRWAKEVTPENPLPEYPRPSMMRRDWKNLNGLWDYAIKQQSDGDAVPKFQGKILVPFAVESALSGVKKAFLPDQRLWYHRVFTIPSSWKDKKIIVHFDAVDYETSVWLNGKLLGSHTGGYDPFSFEITQYLKQGDNTLVLAVTDPSDEGDQARGKQVLKPGGAAYTATSGIWQTVWLEPVPEKYIKSIKITPDIDASSVYFNIRGGVTGKQVKIEIFDKGKLLSTTLGDFAKTIKISLPNAKLWSPENPFLYDVKITLKNDKVNNSDIISSYFGMRKIALGKDSNGVTRLLLNNKFVFQCGPLDQGFWPEGLHTAPTDAALKYDLEYMKSIGFNMVRKHIKIEPERWYYWADKLGMLVWQDMPAGNLRKAESRVQWEKEMNANITRLISHPSIIMWVIFNEGWGQFDTERLVGEIRKLDPSRLIDDASGWYNKRWGDIVDKHFYPGPGVPSLEENRAVVTGEFGGLGFVIPDHVWRNDAWGYQSFKDADSLALAYQRLWQRVYKLRGEKGLSAAVYTQITDVEQEANGILTYDRAVSKISHDKLFAANTNSLPLLKYKTILANSKDEPQKWKYSSEKPADDWNKPGFNAASWKEGMGGFGTRFGKGDIVNTVWENKDMWIRREFIVDEVHWPLISIYYGEDSQIYINGILACTPEGFLNCYGLYEINPEARASIHSGVNRIAVHCNQRNKGGEEYIDVGLVDEYN